MADIIEFLGSNIIYLIIALAVLVAIIIVLFIVQSRLKKKIILKEEVKQKESSLIQDIISLKNSSDSTESLMSSLNKLTRKFFLEQFAIPANLDYHEVAKLLKQKGKPKLSVFSQKMSDSLYSGESISKPTLNSLISTLEQALRGQHPEAQSTDSPVTTKPMIQQSTRIQNPTQDQIKEAYNQLQSLYTQAQSLSLEKKDKANLFKLKEFKKIIAQITTEVSQNPSPETMRKFYDKIYNGINFLNSIIIS